MKHMLLFAGSANHPLLNTENYQAVYQGEIYTGDGAASRIINNGVDLAGKGGFVITRDRLVERNFALNATVLGVDKTLYTNQLQAFDTTTGIVSEFRSDGYRVGSNVLVNNINGSYVSWAFRNADKVISVVKYAGTGVARRQAHGLNATPELWIIKRSNVGSAAGWIVGSTHMTADEFMVFNTTAMKAVNAAYFNGGLPDASTISLGTSGDVNSSISEHMLISFASRPGTLKVGTYIGNDVSRVIDCDFTTGARFVMIKKMDTSTGNWNIIDTKRGINPTTNDPQLYPNAVSVENGSVNWFSPNAAGFQLNAGGWNTLGSKYLFLAIA